MKRMSERTYVLLIVLVGFLLRIRGIQFGLPDAFHADEPIVVHHALAYGTGDFNPHFFKIPPLISYLLFGLYGMYYVIGVLSGTFQNIKEYEALFYTDPTNFYHMGRVIFGALLGTYSVFSLYKLVRANLTREHAVVASLFLAVCFIHVRDSHFIYPDIPLVLVMIISLGVFFRHLGRQNAVRDHLLSGFMIGLATAIKYNGVFIAVPYLIICVSEMVHSRKGFVGLFAAGFSSLVAFALFNPYAFLDYQLFFSELMQESKAHIGGVPFGHHFFRSLVGGIGWPLIILGLIGMFRFETLKSTGRRAILGFILIYFFVIQKLGQPYARYILPIIPFFLIFCAEGFMIVVKRFKVRYIALVLLIVCCITPFAKSIMVGNLLSGQDTRALAKTWIEENIPNEAKVALDIPFYMPRLLLSESRQLDKFDEILDHEGADSFKARRVRSQVEQLKDRPGYQLFHMSLEDSNQARYVLPYQMSTLKREGIEYVVVSQVHENPPHKDFYERLRQEGKLLMEFNPYKLKKIKWPYQHPITGAPFLLKDLMLRDRNGQRIEVYKI